LGAVTARRRIFCDRINPDGHIAPLALFQDYDEIELVILPVLTWTRILAGRSGMNFDRFVVGARANSVVSIVASGNFDRLGCEFPVPVI